jgi:flagellin
MSISVQSSAAALIALENLTSTTTGATQSSSQSGAANQTGEVASAVAQPSSVLDISGAGDDDAIGGAIADLGNAAQIADGAVSAGGAITDLLTQMRQAALSASDPGLATSARAALNSQFQADLTQIGAVVGQASVGGVNLIDGSVSGSLQEPAGDGTTVTLSATNLSVGGPVVGLSAGASLSDPATAASIAGSLDTAIGAVGQAVGQIAAQGQSIENHLDLVIQAAVASSSPGVGGQMNLSMDQDGARLQALQVQQQLQTGGFAVSDQTPQSILALFR